MSFSDEKKIFVVLILSRKSLSVVGSLIFVFLMREHLN